MCDYSLLNVPNRLAREGEELVTHWFPSGSLGLASPLDVQCVTGTSASVPSFWRRLLGIRTSSQPQPVPAVCIPPGARLRIEIPVALQAELNVGSVADVTFTQITADEDIHRDSLRFEDGREVRLQSLYLGQRVTVMDLSSSEESVPENLSEQSEALYSGVE